MAASKQRSNCRNCALLAAQLRDANAWKSCYFQGYEDAMGQKPPSANPYPEGTDAWWGWNSGYWARASHHGEHVENRVLKERIRIVHEYAQIGISSCDRAKARTGFALTILEMIEHMLRTGEGAD